MISESSLGGYVLEELIAYWLNASGYELLEFESQDSTALVDRNGSLYVKGRGADHQADVLGQLKMSVPGAYPLRLFVEAKLRNGKIGLPTVRNAVGIINDVNEHYSAAKMPGYSRFDYRYALFSASGFTDDAVLYAVTHRVSLVNLDTPGFEWLPRVSRTIARAFIEEALKSGVVSPFPTAAARGAVRKALRADQEVLPADPKLESSFLRIATDATAEETYRRGFLAFTSTPFAIILQPDDPESALEDLLAEAGARSSAELHFGGLSEDRGEWVLSRRNRNGRLTSFRVATSEGIEEIVLGGRVRTSGRVEAKLDIVVRDETAELSFDPAEAVTTGSLNQDRRELRRPRLNRSFAVLDDPKRTETATWTPIAFQLLMTRLAEGGYSAQATSILEAAQNGGILSRDRVYEIGGYDSDRTLRGFTRPSNRVSQDLVLDGALDAAAQKALKRGDSKASYFLVPREFTNFV